MIISKKTKKELTYCRKILQQYPDEPSTLVRYYNLLWNTKKYIDAFRVQKRLLILYPKDVAFKREFADTCYKLKKYDHAIKYYREFLRRITPAVRKKGNLNIFSSYSSYSIAMVSACNFYSTTVLSLAKCYIKKKDYSTAKGLLIKLRNDLKQTRGYKFDPKSSFDREKRQIKLLEKEIASKRSFK